MPVERTLPITRSRAREMGSQSCPYDEKIIENAAFGQQNPSLVESHFNPRNEQSITEENAPNASTPTGQHALSSHAPESEHFPALV